jgi:hypothetical protein
LNLINEHGRRMTLEKSARFLFRLLSLSGEVERDKSMFREQAQKGGGFAGLSGPVSTTTGRVFAERCRRGSTARGIHICKIYDIIAYFAYAYRLSCATHARLAIRQMTPMRLSLSMIPLHHGLFRGSSCHGFVNRHDGW